MYAHDEPAARAGDVNVLYGSDSDSCDGGGSDRDHRARLGGRRMTSSGSSDSCSDPIQDEALQSMSVTAKGGNAVIAEGVSSPF